MGSDDENIELLLTKVGGDFRAQVDALKQSGILQERRSEAIAGALRAYHQHHLYKQRPFAWVEGLQEAIRGPLLRPIGAAFGVAIVGFYLSSSLLSGPTKVADNIAIESGLADESEQTSELGLVGVSLAYAEFENELNQGFGSSAMFESTRGDSEDEVNVDDDFEIEDEQLDMEDYENGYDSTWL